MKKRPMKQHMIDIAFGAEDLTEGKAALDLGFAKYATGLRPLEDWQRKRVQHLGTRNETFSMAAIEMARQHPVVVPAGIDMAALERDILARQQLLPILMQTKQFVRLLEDTLLMLGVDIYNGARGIYKSAQIVGDLYGLSAVVDELGRHFAKSQRNAPAPAPEPTTGSGTV